jgi:uncharacterized protein (TIGR03118 family)
MPTFPATAFGQDNLISSNAADGALLLDPAFINAWGAAIRPAGLGGHWWIANTDTARVTLYVGDSPTTPFGQDGLSVLGVPGAPGEAVVVTIDPPSLNGVPLPPPSPTPATLLPPSNPTGQVFSGSATDFLLDGTSLTGTVLDNVPARFITVSEDGTIAAWGESGAAPAQRMDAFAVVIDNSATGAVYKGVTVSADGGSGNRLYAANFSQNRIEVYDAAWRPLATTGFTLTEDQTPGDRAVADFAPFNIERVTDATRGEEVLIVTYARLANAAAGEEESTDGFIVKFDLDGNFLASGDGDGLFNAPWGVALAPAEWGSLDGALLVGNFGDGRILGLDIDTLAFTDYLRDDLGAPVAIDGLWDIIFGNGASLGAADRLYFTAGPAEETQGLFGSLYILPEDDQVRVGTAAGELVSGGRGNDVLLGRGGDDRVMGHAGADHLRGDAGADLMDGGAGRDTLLGGAGADTLNGGDGHDSLDGGAGNDVLDGGTGHDALFGGSGADTLKGGDGRDSLDGGSGADSLLGDRGSDSLDGGTGHDVLDGGGGADMLKGGDGRDSLDGGSGADSLLGDQGNDRLDGGTGNDVLDGGAGRDLLIGGAGADIFVFGRGGGHDTVLDFSRADRLRLLDGLEVEAFRLVETGGGTLFDLAIDFDDGGSVTLIDFAPTAPDSLFIA